MQAWQHLLQHHLPHLCQLSARGGPHVRHKAVDALLPRLHSADLFLVLTDEGKGHFGSDLRAARAGIHRDRTMLRMEDTALFLAPVDAITQAQQRSHRNDWRHLFVA